VCLRGCERKRVRPPLRIGAMFQVGGFGGKGWMLCRGIPVLQEIRRILESLPVPVGGPSRSPFDGENILL